SDSNPRPVKGADRVRRSPGACCHEVAHDPFRRRRGFDHGTRTGPLPASRELNPAWQPVRAVGLSWNLMTPARVAVVQAGAIPFDSDRSLAKAEKWIAEAATSGAQLILFPEAFIGGYPKGEDFGARVGSRTPEGRALFRRYYEGAIDVPGPATARLGEAA